MFTCDDYNFLVSEGIPMLHILSVKFTQLSTVKGWMATEGYIHNAINGNEVTVKIVEEALHAAGYYYGYNGDRFVPTETPKEPIGDEVNLCEIPWQSIGATDEYKDLKRDIGVVCHNVTMRGYIQETCANELFKMLNKHGFKVVKK